MSEVYSWNENDIQDLLFGVYAIQKTLQKDDNFKKLETDLDSILRVMRLTGMDRVYIKGRDPDKL